tara:strand:- start:4856 stop:5089 length:234 start_codon:yes stop_codon:yes gene_type:complete
MMKNIRTEDYLKLAIERGETDDCFIGVPTDPGLQPGDDSGFWIEIGRIERDRVKRRERYLREKMSKRIDEGSDPEAS